jgi:virginiamycin B lyase
LWYIKSGDSKIVYLDPIAKTKMEFKLPKDSKPRDLTDGPDTNSTVWFTERGTNSIGRITTAGEHMHYPVLTPNSGLTGITKGADGNLWFTETKANKIGMITADGASVKEYAVPTMDAGLAYIAGGKDAAWFAEKNSSKLGSINYSTGVITEFDLPAGSKPKSVAVDNTTGYVWVTETGTRKVARFNVATGTVDKEYSLPSDKKPDRILISPSGTVYFSIKDSNNVGIITPDGTLSFAKLTSYDDDDDKDDDKHGDKSVRDIAMGKDGNIWFTDTSSTNANSASVGKVSEQSLVAAAAPVAATPATTPAAEAPKTGGGCAIGLGKDQFDPTFPLLISGVLMFLRRRSKKQ